MATRAGYPPTIIVVHGKENPKKCTVEPLRGRPDVVFCPAESLGRLDLSNYVRLGLSGGPCLSGDDAPRGLLILDGTWRHVARLEAKLQGVGVRTLPPLRTAYPRLSKTFADPAGGLATIEALFAAYHLLGRPTTGLLDHYHWTQPFLAQNTPWLSGATVGTSGSNPASKNSPGSVPREN